MEKEMSTRQIDGLMKALEIAARNRLETVDVTPFKVVECFEYRGYTTALRVDLETVKPIKKVNVPIDALTSCRFSWVSRAKDVLCEGDKEPGFRGFVESVDSDEARRERLFSQVRIITQE